MYFLGSLVMFVVGWFFHPTWYLLVLLWSPFAFYVIGFLLRGRSLQTFIPANTRPPQRGVGPAVQDESDDSDTVFYEADVQSPAPENVIPLADRRKPDVEPVAEPDREAM